MTGGVSVVFRMERQVWFSRKRSQGMTALLASFLTSYLPLRSATYLAHIRRASRGKVSVSNTHPFNRHYKSLEFLFAHNGTLDKTQLKSGTRYRPVGETDSEKAFCYLLSRMEAWKIYPVQKESTSVTPISSSRKSATFYSISTSMDRCLAYFPMDLPYSPTETLMAQGIWHYLEKRQPLSERELENEDIKLKVNLDKDSDEYGFIMATAPLSDGEWVSFQPRSTDCSSVGPSCS